MPNTTRTRYVTLYHVSRHYGGPEEGGWWYDWWEPVTSVSVRNRAHAERVAARLRAENPAPRHSRYSVLGDVDPVILFEARRNEHRSTHAPHYC